MKNLFILLMMVCGLSFTTVSYADTAPAGTVTANQVVSPEDAARLREQMLALSKALGNTVPSATASASASPAAPSASSAPAKTATEVADKAIDMLGNGANKVMDMLGTAVGTLSSNLAKIAPEVWRIMIVQQYAKAVDAIIVPSLLLIMTIVYTVIVRKKIPVQDAWDKSWDDSDSFRFVFRSVVPTILLAAFSIWFVANISDAVKYLINPEYYAIKDILMLITNPAGMTQQ